MKCHFLKDLIKFSRTFAQDITGDGESHHDSWLTLLMYAALPSERDRSSNDDENGDK